MIIGDGFPKWTCGACGMTVGFNVKPERHVLRRAQELHARSWCRPAARPLRRTR